MNPRGKIISLLFFFAFCVTGALLTWHWQLRAERVTPAELYSIVNSQLAAFRADDFPRAYLVASSGVQQKFNVQQFAEMVHADYAGIVLARRVEFGFVEMHGRRAVVQVFFVDQSGQITPCIYTLVSEGETWKIDSARLLRRWPAGARLGGIWS